MQKTNKTAEHILTLDTRVRDADGPEFVVQVFGAEGTDGTWEAWIEFHPANGEGPVLHTGQETSQANRAALDYWAGGLEPVYLEGALKRAGGS